MARETGLMGPCDHCNPSEGNLMHKRITALLIAGLAVAAVGGSATVASAKHGADDPAGHVRHSRGADDTSKTAKTAVRRGRGADDAAGHQRHGHGADDGPNHR
jgi:hypothetical protein